MTAVIFGTAHLFGLVGDADSETLLAAAYDSGYGHVDTAPSYGYGRAEPAVGRLRARCDPSPGVTTKVGLAPAAKPGRAVTVAKAAARRLPATVQKRLKGDSGPGPNRFHPDQVEASITQSLTRLGRIDRLLLHEVYPVEITADLVECLLRYRDRGDIGLLGVATGNDRTAECLARAPEVFQVAHIAVGISSTRVHLPASVDVRVGHGLFGAGGSDLRRLTELLRSQPRLQQQWRDLSAGTAWDGPMGMADALVARAMTLGLTDVIVATSRPDRLKAMHSTVSDGEPLTPAISAWLTSVVPVPG